MPDDTPKARRRPRYLRFILSGALVGLVASGVLTALRADQVEQPLYLLLYLGLMLGGIGALLGGLVAVLIEGTGRP